MMIENKVTLRKIYIEVGRKCTLACKHCCKGESENLTIDYKYIDALLDNVHFIDEIIFTGGEPLLYLDNMKYIIDMVIDRRIKLNYITVLSNGTIRSQDFVDWWNYVVEKTTFPDGAELHFSIDCYHEFDNTENIKWYKEKINRGEIITFDFSEDSGIAYEGNATRWKISEYDKFEEIRSYIGEPSKRQKKQMRKLCTGKDNLCGYCDVKNCISDAMYLSADGYIYANSFLSYETMRMKEHKLSMGKITEKDLYSMVTQWNNECDSATKEPMWMKMNDMRGCRIVDCIDLIISMIDYIKENKFEVVEELYEIFLKKYQLILDEKDLYNSKNHKKSLREIEENKIMIEKTINRNKTANLIMDIWSNFVYINRDNNK